MRRAREVRLIDHFLSQLANTLAEESSIARGLPTPSKKFLCLLFLHIIFARVCVCVILLLHKAYANGFAYSRRKRRGYSFNGAIKWFREREAERIFSRMKLVRRVWDWWKSFIRWKNMDLSIVVFLEKVYLAQCFIKRSIFRRA